MTELQTRLKLKNPACRLSYSEALPIKDLFDILEERRSVAQSYNKLSEDMAARTNELLFIQKRLLTRYKEKNSAPLNNLDVLLETAVSELISMTKEHEKLQLFYKKNSQKVAIAFKMFMTLIPMRFPISDDGVRLLDQYLPSHVEPTVQKIGWVEIVDLNIFYLLRTVLGGAKEDPATAKGYQPIENLETFQQHFTLLIDKLSKGLLANYQAGRVQASAAVS